MAHITKTSVATGDICKDTSKALVIAERSQQLHDGEKSISRAGHVAFIEKNEMR